MAKIEETTMTAFTKGGAVGLFQFYQKAYGVTLIKAPWQLDDGTERWSVTFTKPIEKDIPNVVA